MSSPILPPFTLQSATKKVKLAQALWNTTDHVKVATAYTPSSTWRNRGEFVKGTKEIESLLQKKWEREQDYVLRKELFAFNDNRIAVQFWYEYSRPATEGGPKEWFRCYGLEHWVFEREGQGKMARRQMSGNDIPIKESERWFKDGVDPDTVTITDEHWTLDAPLE